MSAVPPGHDYRQQDGQVLWAPGPGRPPHPEYQWRRRAPEEWEDLSVRVAWREGDPIDWAGNTYARIHEPSGMLLIAEYGCIQTVIQTQDLEKESQREIVREYKEGMVDDDV